MKLLDGHMPCHHHQDYASLCTQGTPLTPMDISPQQFTDAAASAPTPPPQPSFTPQAAAPPNPIFQFSFGTSASQSAPKPSEVRHSPRGKKPAAAKPAADLPKSNLGMPPKASAGSGGLGSGFGGPAQAQARSTGSAAAAGFAAQPASHSAMPNGFSTSQTAPSGFFASGVGRPSTAMPFAVPGRLMDSRIPDACAMGFMGINLDSAPAQSAFSAQPAAAAHAATAEAQPAAAGASFASQAPPRAAFPDTHATYRTSAGTDGSYAERGNLGNASSRPPSHEASFGISGGSAAAAEGQAPAAAQAAPPSPYSFTMGAAVTPKQHFGRTIFGSEHLATNLHDKLVLEEQLAAAAAAGFASSEAGRAAPAPAAANQSDAGLASSAEVPFQAEAPAGTADHQANPADGPAPSSSSTAQQHAAQSTAACGTATATAAAQSAAAPPPFVFGRTSAATAPFANGAGAADSASHAQRQGSLFGTTNNSAFFAQQAAAQPAQSAKPFVFGTSLTSSASSTASAQPKGSNSFPPAGSSAGASQPAPFSKASAASMSGVPAPFAPGQANIPPARNGLHPLSGVPKHTSSRGSAGGAGLQNRAVAGSPQAWRTRASPRKQTSPQVRACHVELLHSWCSSDL